MKRSLTKVVLGAGMATLALLSLSAASWSRGPGPMDHMPDPARMVSHMSEQLELSAVQREQVQQIVLSTREQSDAYREEMQQLREQLRAMRSGFDEDTARAITDRIGVISGEMAYVAARTQAEIYELLTEQQRAEMQAMMEKRHAGKDRGHRRSHDRQGTEPTG